MKSTLKSMVENIFGNGFYQDMLKAVTFNVGSIDSPEGTSLWGAISGIYNNVILPVGYALLCLYFLIELIEKTSSENLNFEHFIRLFIKLIVGKMLMDNALTLLFGMIDFSNSIVAATAEGYEAPGSSIDLQGIKDSIDAINKWGILTMIGLWAKLIIPYVGNVVVNILASVICWSRSVDIVVRMLMAPIAMPDIFSEGTRGNGFRYLKKFLAVCLQGAIILAIVIAMNILYLNIVTNSIAGKNPGEPVVFNSYDDIPDSFFISSLIMSFTTVTLVMRSKEWANDIVGV